jgi:hypothetical protein
MGIFEEENKVLGAFHKLLLITALLLLTQITII